MAAVRNRKRTIESLRRLAERPGTPAEGETARRLLERMTGKPEVVRPKRPFDPSQFPRGTPVWYCYWCYDNDPGMVACDAPKTFPRSQWPWMRVKFDHLKQARWVPVTSRMGCHLSLTPFEGEERAAMYQMDWDWEAKRDEIMTRLAESRWYR